MPNQFCHKSVIYLWQNYVLMETTEKVAKA